MRTEDKFYHVACAIPVVQTFVGGAFAVKDIIGIIKDISMSCLFPYYESNLKVNILNLQKTLKDLKEMRIQWVTLSRSARCGNDEEKKVSVVNMKKMRDSLRNMGMLSLSDLINNLKSIDYMDVGEKTDSCIRHAVNLCENQVSSLNFSLFFAEAVPAKTRIYNLATNIISMIPTYRIGTVYNLGTLAYKTFLK